MKNNLPTEVKNRALTLVGRAMQKYTQPRLVQELVGAGAHDRAIVKKVIRELVDDGELSYTYQHGCSFLEKSIQHMNQISDRVVLGPVGLHAEGLQDQICVRLGYGAAFGTGRHPTTRLSLQAIDYLLSRRNFFDSAAKGTALDIGTGSGVLAIAAVKLGMNRAIGLDIESISRKEAAENVEHNGLSTRIQISDKRIDEIVGTFRLIMANLRLPTLKKMIPFIRRLSIPGGGVILSGIKKEELSALKDTYGENDFSCIWQRVETGWACQAFMKNTPGGRGILKNGG